MDYSQISFLIECDRNLKILNIYWNQPVYIISPYQKKITDLFSEAEAESVEKIIEDAYAVEESIFCKTSLELRSPSTNISACFMSAEETVLVLGFDLSGLNEDSIPAFKTLIHNFMKLIKMASGRLLVGNEQVVKSQFEQIQKLNNDLLNMQRQIKKANVQLKRLNSDLNNRLVKDALTGLISRYQYREEIDLLIKSNPEKQGIFTFVDIDNFKSVNDNYGHAAGDIYLKTFAQRLSKVSPRNSIFMRISGDEFGIYTHGYESVGQIEIESIWREIEKNIISRPIEIEGKSLGVSCSAGMSIYGKDTEGIYDLIEYADFAMYVAKKNGKNSYRQFDIEQYKTKSTSNI